jgi:ferritin-like metal-binding protein YciE
MANKTLDDQLNKYLTDAHSIEEQALPQLRAAPDIAADPGLASVFREHLKETEAQERLVRQRLEARGASPSRVKDAVMKAGGVGFALFAKSQPDTPGKLAAHAYSFEHLELAGYELLMRVADRAGDAETAAVAGRIRDEEQRMAERLEAGFDRAVDASLEAKGAEDPDAELDKYLVDAHALESQSIQLLERGPKIGGEPELERLYADHLEETRRQQELLEARLLARDSSPSRLQDAAMRLGALNWGAFFQAQPDTPGKLAAFAYAFEHLEIAGYELLWRVARRAGDQDTIATAQRLVAQERSMAERLAAAFDRAAEASLSAQGVPA